MKWKGYLVEDIAGEVVGDADLDSMLSATCGVNLKDCGFVNSQQGMYTLREEQPVSDPGRVSEKKKRLCENSIVTHHIISM